MSVSNLAFSKYLLKSISIFFILCFTQAQIFACDCDRPPNTFIASISTFTAALEVVQIDTLSQEGVYKYWPLVLTKLKITKSFRSHDDVQFVWMNNARGGTCERGLFPNDIGEKYIITGEIRIDKRYDPWIDDGADRLFLHVTTCGKAVLDIQDNQVYGVITKNKDKKIKERYDQLMLEDPSKAKAYYAEVYQTKHHKDRVQKMPIHKFYKLMDK